MTELKESNESSNGTEINPVFAITANDRSSQNFDMNANNNTNRIRKDPKME
jgi:hypothetical protein